MSNATQTNALNYLFALSHSDEGWILPFPAAIEAVTHEAASFSPAPGVASIWELAEHASNYLANLAAELEGRQPTRHDEWPTVTDQSPAAWKRLQERVKDAAARVEKSVGALDERRAAGPLGESPLFERVADIAIHDAYHAGQVVKLTQIFEATR